jgi:hypothetical protein
MGYGFKWDIELNGWLAGRALSIETCGPSPRNGETPGLYSFPP